MTAKKRRYSRYSSSNKLSIHRTKSDPDISWSNSDTDDELTNSRKKRKLAEKSSNWIKTDSLLSSQQSDEDDKSIDSDETNRIIEQNQNESPILTHSESNRISPEQNESPIISKSPILTQTIFRQKSPVISGRTILQRIKSRHEEIGNINEDSFSSTEIQSQDTQISDCVEISPVKSQLSQQISDLTIDVVLTQDSSPVVIDSSTSSSITGSQSPLPLRRKQFKKGGLGYQLMRAINSQKTDYNRWQHELFLNKSDNRNRIDFKIVKYWLDYNLNCYECELISDTIERFLLIVGYNCVKLSFVFDIGGEYSMFLPYSWRFVRYKSRDWKCYFNCVKFLKNR